MGSQLVKVEVSPGENEQIELIIKVPEEPRSIIHGVVKDHHGNVIESAVVKLFEHENPCNPCSMKPVTHAFTDECGQFLFGPLSPCKHYVIKVWVNDIKIRHMIIKPRDEDTCEVEIEKDDDRIEEKRDVVITGRDRAEENEMKLPVNTPNPPVIRNRLPVRRPRQP